ncbi:MAG: DUF2007 domain-containing protein [Balneola sp.]|nr:DUF2007 domain-containing protein [Balneola sp.]MBO6651597.1 DUF2007 domain-containing protein [Balneola sp.]MBO6710948.1 DUF2007 domain-containing protein [Balneola sp.]MBO6799635.1 DUF2007 domain-containing protein [Balneola sp.]MBO6870368.1 DUF2007 domain-containing protein [Balneola sp.]
MAEPKLVVVHSFYNPNDAYAAKSILEDSDIPAFLLDSNTSTSTFGSAIAIGGNRLAVADYDLKEAGLIIEEFLKLINDPSIETETIRCPRCHSELVTNKPVIIIKALLTFFITTLFLFSSNPYYYCKRCKYKWNENKRA